MYCRIEKIDIAYFDSIFLVTQIIFFVLMVLESFLSNKSALCCLYIVLSVIYGVLLLNSNEITPHTAFRRFLMEDEHLPHKDLYPMDDSDWWGTVLMTLGLLGAASGGIGGGGILVPLFILVFNFKPRYAIPLSNFCILGSSITNMILNLPKRHPSANRPLVDWDLILVMEPLTMAGAVSSSLNMWIV